MESTRFPGKVLEYFSGNTMLGHIINRLKYVKGLSDIIVATGEQKKNSRLLEYCQSNGISVYSGHEEDVLSRYYNISQKVQSDYVVRITADDPLKDPRVIDLAISTILEDNSLDYVSNTIEPSFPEGIDVEIIKFSALEKAFHLAKLSSEREHVTPFIWKNPSLFKILNFRYSEDLSFLRWTVDYPEDLDFVKNVYKYYSGRDIFYMEDVLNFIKNTNTDSRTAHDVIRNEGYMKVVGNEK